MLNVAQFDALLSAVLAQHNVSLDSELTEELAEELGGAMRNAALASNACARDNSYRGKLYAFSSSDNYSENITDDNVSVYWDDDEQAFVLSSDGVIAYNDFTVATFFAVGDSLSEYVYEHDDSSITLREAVDYYKYEQYS